jgi:hypothetical protein
MTKTNNKASFKMSGRHHLEKIGEFDVWEKRITDVDKGVHTPYTKYVVTKKVKVANPHFNVVNLENVELDVEYDTVGEAKTEATRLNDKQRQ